MPTNVVRIVRWFVIAGLGITSGCASLQCHGPDGAVLDRERAIAIADRFLVERGQTLSDEQRRHTFASENRNSWSVHYELTGRELPAGPVVNVSKCDGSASYQPFTM
jgi:hypothetical protein